MRNTLAFIFSIPLLAFFLLLTIPFIVLAVVLFPLAVLLCLITWLAQGDFNNPLRFAFCMATIPLSMYAELVGYDGLANIIDDISLG